MAAASSNPAGLYNFGRCLEFGRGLPRDSVRAAKYYRKSADLGEGMAENRFGISLECGVGVGRNIWLAAEYYQRSALDRRLWT
jgi:TPR repeat protein